MQLNSRNTLEPRRFLKYEGQDNSLIIPRVLSLITKEDTSICDVGGATGNLLSELIRRSKIKIKPVIMEIDNYYKNKLRNKQIRFLNLSILESKLQDEMFDIIIFRHLLHHIISNNLRNTIKLQSFALNEIFRITKKGGYVVFIELVNEIKLFSWIIYLLSKIANRLKIEIKKFNTGTVIVHFLTRKNLEALINSYSSKYNLNKYEERYFRRKLSLKWKLSLLMNKTGALFNIIKVKK